MFVGSIHFRFEGINLTTDDILLELNRSVADYMRRIHPFKYKNKTYRLIDNYVATPTMRCDICGDYPELEISIIESDEGHTLHVGTDCIDRLTGQNVSEWMKNFRKKRENIMANRKYIDPLTRILGADDRSDPSLQIPEVDAKKLRAMLDQLSNGLNLTAKQQQLADAYLTVTVTA
jgi:hypothetical protein